jgi:hypothetical protein
VSLTLASVDPADLPRFRPELVAILERCPKGYTLDWILERIDAGALHPLVIVDADRHVGLVLVSIDDSGPRRCLYLFGVGAASRPRSVLVELGPSLRDLARHLGCAVIQGVSSRRGWARHARPIGTIYELEV